MSNKKPKNMLIYDMDPAMLEAIQRRLQELRFTEGHVSQTELVKRAIQFYLDNTMVNQNPPEPKDFPDSDPSNPRYSEQRWYDYDNLSSDR